LNRPPMLVFELVLYNMWRNLSPLHEHYRNSRKKHLLKFNKLWNVNVRIVFWSDVDDWPICTKCGSISCFVISEILVFTNIMWIYWLGLASCLLCMSTKIFSFLRNHFCCNFLYYISSWLKHVLSSGFIWTS